jgi:hypothetical protein
MREWAPPLTQVVCCSGDVLLLFIIAHIPLLDCPMNVMFAMSGVNREYLQKRIISILISKFLTEEQICSPCEGSQNGSLQ